MAETSKSGKKRFAEIMRRALKATIKGTIFYAVYLIISIFLTPVFDVIPDLQQIVVTFVAVYIFFIVIGEVLSGTIFQHLFNIAKALFVILYLIFSLEGGIVGTTFHEVKLTLDLRLFLMAATLLSLLGLAKSMFQAIDFLNERAESSRM
jgi:hypothetical protein